MTADNSRTRCRGRRGFKGTRDAGSRARQTAVRRNARNYTDISSEQHQHPPPPLPSGLTVILPRPRFRVLPSNNATTARSYSVTKRSAASVTETTTACFAKWERAQKRYRDRFRSETVRVFEPNAPDFLARGIIYVSRVLCLHWFLKSESTVGRCQRRMFAAVVRAKIGERDGLRETYLWPAKRATSEEFYLRSGDVLS